MSLVDILKERVNQKAKDVKETAQEKTQDFQDHVNKLNQKHDIKKAEEQTHEQQVAAEKLAEAQRLEEAAKAEAPVAIETADGQVIVPEISAVPVYHADDIIVG